MGVPVLLWAIAAAAAVCAVSRLLQVFVQKFWSTRQCKPVPRGNYRLKGFPFVGILPELMCNLPCFHDWLVSKFEEHHTITATMHGTLECYFTVDVENLKYILKTNFDNYIKGGLFHERFQILLGDGVFNTDGEMWKLQRKTVMPEFTSRNLRYFYAAAYTDVALRLSCLLDEIVQQGVAVDLQDLFLRMTLEAIGKVGFGVDIGCLPWQLPLPENSFARAFDSASETVSHRFVDPLWKLKRFFKVGYEAGLEANIEVIDSFTFGVIAQRKLEIAAAREEQATGVALEEPKLDIITRFLKLAEDGKNGVDCKLIRDICLNFVIAGRDSTAVTLSWLVYSLIQKPEIAAKLHEELRSFEAKNQSLVNSEEHSPVDDAAYAKVDKKIREFVKMLSSVNLKTELPYLTAVISETVRLYPAVPEIPKGIKDDDVLPDGTRVRKGMIITYSPYSMGRMMYIWGPDAKEFNPERWLHDGEFVMESEFKLTAFQAGFRMCMGRDSAYTQMKITAAILYRFFEFQLVEGHSVEYKLMVILYMANGLKVNIRRRDDSKSEKCR
ncbi:unnamed protein product [Calypogeia fissa]